MAASDWPGGVEVPHQWGSCATEDTAPGADLLDYVRTMHAKNPDTYGIGLGPAETCVLLALIDRMAADRAAAMADAAKARQDLADGMTFNREQHTRQLREAKSAARQFGYDTGWADGKAGLGRRDVR